MKTMKRIIAVLALVSAFAATGAEATADMFSLVNDANGYSYLKINSDMDAFAFTSDFKSIGNGGAVGFFKYPEGLEGNALKAYIDGYDEIDARFAKHVNDGRVDLGDVKAGDRLGFYLERNNGDLVKGWAFEYKKGQPYIAFAKNGAHGKDEWMSVSDFTHSESDGAPLPGSLAVLLVGGMLAGVGKLRRKKAV